MKAAMLYEQLEEDTVRCHLCHHQCKISNGGYGICNVRKNQNGDLYTHAYGEAIGLSADPIEKKPLYHFLPGTTAYSFATPGCNFKCEFCQNWRISQAVKEEWPAAAGLPASPEDILKQAISSGSSSIAYTYTEPTIFFEYAYDTPKLAAAEGIKNIFVTNGYMSAEALNTLQPYLHACNVDLKAFNNDFYKTVCHGRLQPVLDNIRRIHEMNIWLEITTLIIPDQNDGAEELRAAA